MERLGVLYFFFVVNSLFKQANKPAGVQLLSVVLFPETDLLVYQFSKALVLIYS